MATASAPQESASLLDGGDFAPWFVAPTLDGRTQWHFASAGGKRILLFFMGSAGNSAVAAALTRILAHKALFDDERRMFFGVTADRADESGHRIVQRIPGIRYFLDYGLDIAKLYGAADGSQYRPHLLLLDGPLQVVRRYTLDEVDAAIAALAQDDAPTQDWAPVLIVPRLLEPDLCRALIDVYDRAGGAPSGFMREVGGKTTLIVDDNVKKRTDAIITDPALKQALANRIVRRLVPAIHRTFQFRATRIERYIVAAYDAETGGFFMPHRDNTTSGTAHRRFAVTINLNEDYDGGDLRFPEFGARTYRAPPGGAAVFSCSLLHEATPVTRGRRYATLPFLYDDAAAEIRRANNAFLDEGVERYGGKSATVREPPRTR